MSELGNLDFVTGKDVLISTMDEVPVKQNWVIVHTSSAKDLPSISVAYSTELGVGGACLGTSVV